MTRIFSVKAPQRNEGTIAPTRSTLSDDGASELACSVRLYDPSPRKQPMKFQALIPGSLRSLVAVAMVHCQPSASSLNVGTRTSGGATIAVDAQVLSNVDAAIDRSETDSPWARLSAEDLRRIVRDHAISTLHEVAPELQISRLAEYAQNPSAAPELSGKAVEQIVHLAQVELSAGNAQDAERWITVARARARNRNSAFVANVLFAEAKRQLARGRTAP
jgi:hypothetical protein